MKRSRWLLGVAPLALFVFLTAADKGTVNHTAVLSARMKFEKRVAAAVAPVRADYVSELKSLRTTLTRQSDLDGVAAVDAELQRLQKQRRLWDRHTLEGLWEVKYSNGATRTYIISNTGEAQFVEEQKVGQISLDGNDYLLEFSDDNIERIALQPMLKVEHFHPKSTYPLGTPHATGTGLPTRR
ncbi:MAG: hypothetical protein U0992_02455 [Planctomycetaceae bacterium]